MSKKHAKDEELRKKISAKYSIYQRSFTREGTTIALPLCFPGASIPIPSAESRITALAVNSEGVVYGGTSGQKAHLFFGMLRAATGMVFDMGAVENADTTAAVCCGKKQFAAFVNGPEGGRIIMRQFEHTPFDLLQEWGFRRIPLVDLGEVLPGENIRHAVAGQSADCAIGVTETHLFRLHFETQSVEVVADVPGIGRIALTSKGHIVGFDDRRAVWRFDPQSSRLERNTLPLPEGNWAGAAFTWARDPISGILYTADADGRLFSFDEKGGFSGSLGTVPISPVGPMAVTHDGRLFGMCGDGICKMFSYNPRTRAVSNLASPVSVIGRRRYGFAFADAVTGNDGEIYFGENDNLGHLWIYFPKIQPAGKE